MTTATTAPRPTRTAEATDNTGVVFRLDGPLDADRLRAAFEDAATQIGADGARWTSTSVADVRPDARDRRIEVLIRREFAQPLASQGAIGLRAHVIDRDDDRHVFVAVARRREWDLRSWELFFDYIGAHYDVRELPEMTVLAEPPVAERLDPADAEHWRELLCPIPNRPALPGTRSSRQTIPDARLRHTVPIAAGTVARLHSTASTLTVDPSALLLTALNSVVYRWTGTSDFLVTVPVDTRQDAAAIGHYERSVLVRAAVGRHDRFAELAARIDAAHRAAIAHQNCSVDSAAGELGIDAPEQVADIGFRLRARHDGIGLGGVDATRVVPASSTIALVDVTVSLPRSESDGGELEITSRAGALEPTALQRLADAVVHFLSVALHTPDASIDTIELFDDAARSTVLEASHGPIVPTPASTLVAMIEQRVTVSPDRVALASDTDQLTYRELNARSNRLAHSLIHDGIGAEDIVAVRLDGLVDIVTAMLGILKSGAAYLPIDPDYPTHHVDYLLGDARRPQRVLDALHTDSDLPDTNPGDDDRVRPLRPDNLAYVMYSSGSTGIPKGVLVSHRAIAEHLAGLREEFALDADDRLLQTSSIGFDASLLEIFHTLAAGARLIVPKPDAARDYPYIADLIVRHRATVVHMVPSMLRTFLLLSKVNEWIGVRHIPVGGEPLPGDVADRLGTVCDAALTNNYGPTEAIVSATRYPIVTAQGTRTVPIGTPNRNVYLFLLDSSLRLVPDGAVGEIYLGGHQLARGYANLPGLTAERFVADPFSDGGLLFRTGDLARRTGGGVIDFVGRADVDVTIRGMRVDLGEVESAVTSHPAVEHCVVLPTETASGRALAAYLVTDPTAPPVDVGAVHRHVAELLPEYLAPKAFAVIDEVPVTAHGKLDQLALPTPQPIR